MKRSTSNRIALATIAASLVVWFFQSLHWNSLLDGDSALYSLMSLDVLQGRHYLYTAGQAHGGTPLVYLRALLFAIFGPSQFMGFFINGIVYAIAAGLWAAFAVRVSGPIAGASMGLMAALGSQVLAQYSCTDYYALSLLLGGLMLHLAALLAAKESTLPRWSFFAMGLLLGFAYYVCRFTPLYALLALAFYLALASATARATLVPSVRELLRTPRNKGLVSRLLIAAAAFNAFLFVPAFFTEDQFFGVNAEVSLKLAVKLAGLAWLLHRWPLFFSSPLKLILTATGLLIGLLPHFAFQATNPRLLDRTTGIVRWNDFAELLPEVPLTIGAAFSRASPLSWGLIAAAASLLLVTLGFTGRDRRARRVLGAVVLGTAPCIASWFLIHTYMYFKVQYFYPSYFPLYLCMGLALGAMRLKPLGVALLGLAASAAVVDLHSNFTKPNTRLESGVLEQMRAWDVDRGTGDYDATYDLMWAYKGAVTLDPVRASRFPHFRAQVDEAQTLGYIRRRTDYLPPEERAKFEVLETKNLKHDFVIELVRRRNH